MISFAQQFMTLYDEIFFVYNHHVITHLADECQLHGPLGSFSAFPFENYLQKMQNYIKKSSYPLQQLKNRIGEHVKFDTYFKKKVPRQKNNSYIVITNNRQLIISTELNDTFIYTNNNIYQVRNISKHNQNFILNCNRVVELLPFFKCPLISSEVGIYCCERIKLEQKLEQFNADNVVKVSCIKLNDIVAFSIILHTDS